MQIIRVPSLAENVNEATIGHWLVKPGDVIEPGQGVVELITEKAEFTLEAEEGGRVDARLAPEKSVMPVGSALLVLDATEEEIHEVREENLLRVRRHLSSPTVEINLNSGDALQAPPRAPAPGGSVRATPAARRLAKELGVDLQDVAERFENADILKEDHVREFADD